MSNLENKVIEIKKSIKEKRKEIKVWKSFISGYSSDVWRLEKEIAELEELIEDDTHSLEFELQGEYEWLLIWQFINMLVSYKTSTDNE